jgi:hypothetical protein
MPESLPDRSHLEPARLVGLLVAQASAPGGGLGVGIWPQDPDQQPLDQLTGPAPTTSAWP